KRRLAEIRGWRKALALGAAGLAGLAPMKAQAGEPAPAAPYTQTAGQNPADAPPLSPDQATTATNCLTDHNPHSHALHVERVAYDSATDSYTWTGPKTGKPQSWPRAALIERFGFPIRLPSRLMPFRIDEAPRT